jgi:hypothetical protein
MLVIHIDQRYEDVDRTLKISEFRTILFARNPQKTSRRRAFFCQATVLGTVQRM